MHQMYRHLVDEFECEITNEIWKDVLLQSLPPSYSAFVEGYVMAKSNDNFHQCLRQLKSLKVERAAEMIVKPGSICHIQYYKCFRNTYAVLYSMRYLFQFCWKQDLWSKVFMEKMPWRPGEDMLDVSLAPIYLNIYLQV
jgi:hypothetical protein